MAFNCRASSHMRASQDLDAKVREADAGLLRGHRHEAVRRHAGRRVHFEERERAVRAKDQVESSPAAAADNGKRVERALADLFLQRLWKSTRAEIPRVVGEIFVVIV